MKANVYPGRLEAPDWNSIDCLSRGRLPPHAYLVPFPDLSSCRHTLVGNARYASPYTLMLNGSWSFARYPSVSRLPEKIASLRAGFAPAEVPACWQLSGLGTQADQGAAYPFPVNPPRLPDDIPVGVYRRALRLPLTLGGLRKRIVFQGVSSAFHLFVNGRESGYSEGPGLPAEFDITSQLHDGDNELMLYVYGFSATSWLNARNGPVLQGVFRDVYIEAVPPLSVYDLKVRTVPVEESQWRLEVEAMVVSYRISTESPTVRVLLLADDDVLFEAESRVALTPCAGEWEATSVQSRASALFTADLAGISPWSAESPVLYQLAVCILDRQGHEHCCVSQAVGFRTVTESEGRLVLNGQPLNLFPVSWDGLHPERGTALTIDDMVAAISLMKRCNVNAVITGPLPPDPIFLELCDIYGIYVIARLPVAFPRDCSGVAVADDPRLLPACLERTRRLLARDRCRASVTAWSLAGSDQPGLCHDGMRQLAADLDRNRPVLVCLPDPWPDAEDFNADAVADFWRAICDQPWHDHSLGLAGGDAPWFRAGLARPNHKPYAALRDLAQVYQPVRVLAVDAVNGAFVLASRRSFTLTGDLAARFLVLRDGLEILAGGLDALRIEPQGRRFIELPFGDLRFDDGSEYLLRIEFEQAEDQLYAPAGHPVGFAEFRLSPRQAALPQGRPAHAGIRLRLERDRHLSILSGHRFYLVFNHVSGAFEACRNGEKELFCSPVTLAAAGLTLSAGPQLLLWRAPTDADRRHRLSAWQALGYDRLEQQVMSVESACDGQSAVIESVALLAAPGSRPLFRAVLRQEVVASGSLRLFVSLEPLLPDLPMPPRIGLRLFLRPEYAQATYYGRGPRGSLPDALTAAAVCAAGSLDRFRGDAAPESPAAGTDPADAGLCTALVPEPVSSQHTGIFRLAVSALPEAGFCHQENGVRSNVRYLKLQDDQGFGLLVGGEEPFLFTARTSAMEDLIRTPAGTALPQRAFTELILDARQNPNDGQPAGSMPPGAFKFAFTLMPIVS